MRLIDVDAIPESATAISTDGRLFVAWSEIVKAPTIDPESLRPHGEWTLTIGKWGTKANIQCSNCGRNDTIEAERREFISALPSYCQCCGAKMRLGVVHETD